MEDASVSTQLLNKYQKMLQQKMAANASRDAMQNVDLRASLPAASLKVSESGLLEPPSPLRSVVHDSPRNGYDAGDAFRLQMQAECNARVEQLQASHNAAMDNVKRFHSEQIKQLERERDTVLEQSRHTITALNQRVQGLEEQLTRRTQRAESLESELRDQKAVLEQKITMLQEQNTSLTRRNDELSSSVQQLTEQLRVTKIDLQSGVQQQLLIQQQGYEAQITMLQGSNRGLQGQISQLNEEHQRLIQGTIEDMKSLNQIIEQHQEKIARLRQERDLLRQKALILSSENDRIKEEQGRNGQEVEQLRTRNQNLIKELMKCDKIVYGRK